MHPGQVVVLLEVLGDQLPVGGHVEGAPLVDVPAVEAVPGHPLGQVPQPFGQRRCALVQAGVHVQAPGFHPHRQQGQLRRVEVGPGHLVEQRRGHQRAVEPVSPAVIRAADHARHRAVLGGQFGPPVAARVDEAPQHAVAIPGYEHRGVAHSADQHAARLGHFGRGGHRHPGPSEQPALLQREEAAVGVGGRRQAGGLLQRPAGPRPELLGRGTEPEVRRVCHGAKFTTANLRPQCLMACFCVHKPALMAGNRTQNDSAAVRSRCRPRPRRCGGR